MIDLKVTPISLSDELTLKVVDVSVGIHQVFLFIITFDLDPSEPFTRKVFWIVDIDEVFVFAIRIGLHL